MFKKVVSSVKTAWNTAVEEFEQQQQHTRSASSASFYTHPNYSQTSGNGSLLNGFVGNGPPQQHAPKTRTGSFRLRKSSVKRTPSEPLQVTGSAAQAARVAAYKNKSQGLQENIPPEVGHSEKVHLANGVKRKASRHEPWRVEPHGSKSEFPEDAARGMQNLDLTDRNELPTSKRRKFFKTLGGLSKRSRNSLNLGDDQRTVQLADNNSVSTEARETLTLAGEQGLQASEHTIQQFKVRILELEALVAQKDNIIKIMREEIHRFSSHSHSKMKTMEETESDDYETEDEDNDSALLYSNRPSEPVGAPLTTKPMLDIEVADLSFADSVDQQMSKGHLMQMEVDKPTTATTFLNPPPPLPRTKSTDSMRSTCSTVSSASSSMFTMLPTTAPAAAAQRAAVRPESTLQEVGQRFDKATDQQYYGHHSQSFEVLSPIAIDLDRFVSMHDPLGNGRRV